MKNMNGLGIIINFNKNKRYKDMNPMTGLEKIINSIEKMWYEDMNDMNGLGIIINFNKNKRYKDMNHMNGLEKTINSIEKMWY